jgi:hypothetical protein
MGKTIIFIWGGAILLYLLVSNSSGSSSIINSLGTFVGGTTKVLQGR